MAPFSNLIPAGFMDVLEDTKGSYTVNYTLAPILSMDEMHNNPL